MAKEFSWREVKVEPNEGMTGRRYFSATPFEDKCFLFGGQIPSKLASDLFQIFDPVELSLKVGSSQGELPKGRWGHSAVVYNRKLCIFGGNFNKSSLNDFYQYDFDREVWSKINGEEGDVWPSPREFHSAAVHGNSMFVFGGSNGIRKHKDDFFKYNFDTGKFSVVSVEGDKPGERAGQLTFYKDGYLYVYGGFTGDGGFTFLDDMWRIYLDNPKKWEQINHFGLKPGTGRPIQGHVHGNNLFVFGGFDGEQANGLIRMLDLNTFEWTSGELWMSMTSDIVASVAANTSSKSLKPFARYGSGIFIDKNNMIWVIFGSGSTYLKDIIEICPLD